MTSVQPIRAMFSFVGILGTPQKPRTITGAKPTIASGGIQLIKIKPARARRRPE